MASSGYFIRAKRDGKWQSLDLCELTNEEFDEWCDFIEKEDPDPKKAFRLWLTVLQKLIREAEGDS